MQVKVLPLWGQVTPNLTTPSKLGILLSEAGNRAQSEARQIATLVLTGRRHG